MNRRATTTIAACGVGVCVLVFSRFAEAKCTIDLVPPDAPTTWISAVNTASLEISSRGTQDCRSIEVAVRPSGGALVTFMTTDGRRADRALMSPEELGPALQALLVTLPADLRRTPSTPTNESGTLTNETPTSPRQVGDKVPGTNTAPLAQPKTEISTVEPKATAPEVHFNVGAALGARFGFGGPYVAPAILLRPAGTFGAWELGGIVELDPSYAYLPKGAPAGFQLWSFIAALQVGRREDLGKLAVGYGIGLGIAAIQEEAKDADGTATVGDFAQPRASAYGRLIFPRGARWRGTFDVGLDAVLGSVKRRASLRKDLPDLPRWGISASLGLETSVL